MSHSASSSIATDASRAAHLSVGRWLVMLHDPRRHGHGGDAVSSAGAPAAAGASAASSGAGLNMRCA